MGAPASLRDDTPEDAPRWLDAPTCEGWWWFGEEVVEVYHDKRRNKLLVLYAGFDEQTEPKAGRWFGPLLPPSVVSGATSSGA